MDKKRRFVFLFAISGMLALIFDAKTALRGAQEGVSLCIRSLIPALFPFLFLSALITRSFTGCYKSLNRLCDLLKIPYSCQSILITGALGGYPVGAQCVYDAYRDGRLTKQQAHRILGFCSNAGPAFILGLGCSLFSNIRTAVFLWVIHILSAFLTALLLPKKDDPDKGDLAPVTQSPVQLLQNCVKTMGVICGWVVLFRVFYTLIDKWALCALPSYIRIFLLGISELSNGFISLQEVDNEALRFYLASIVLAFGGICVYLQTASVTKELGTGLYFPGKVMHSSISSVLSLLAGLVLFPDNQLPCVWIIGLPIGIFGSIALILVVFRKNKGSISRSNAV